MKPYMWFNFLGCVGVSLVAHSVLDAAGYAMILTAVIYTIGSLSE